MKIELKGICSAACAAGNPNLNFCRGTAALGMPTWRTGAFSSKST